jgi:hypothetical protein
MLLVACVNITGDNVVVQPKEKKHREKTFSFPFFGYEIEHY